MSQRASNMPLNIVADSYGISSPTSAHPKQQPLVCRRPMLCCNEQSLDTATNTRPSFLQHEKPQQSQKQPADLVLVPGTHGLQVASGRLVPALALTSARPLAAPRCFRPCRLSCFPLSVVHSFPVRATVLQSPSIHKTIACSHCNFFSSLHSQPFELQVL